LARGSFSYSAGRWTKPKATRASLRSVPCGHRGLPPGKSEGKRNHKLSGAALLPYLRCIL
jgi:hypothetical protein